MSPVRTSLVLLAALVAAAPAHAQSGGTAPPPEGAATPTPGGGAAAPGPVRRTPVPEPAAPGEQPASRVDGPRAHAPEPAEPKAAAADPAEESPLAGRTAPVTAAPPAGETPTWEDEPAPRSESAASRPGGSASRDELPASLVPALLALAALCLFGAAALRRRSLGAGEPLPR